MCICQAHLSVQEGRLGLTTNAVFAAVVYPDCQALVLGRVLNAASAHRLLGLPKRRPERALTRVSIAPLKDEAERAKEEQMKDLVGATTAVGAGGKEEKGKKLVDLFQT